MNQASEAEARYGCPVCLSVFRLGFSRCPIDGAVLQSLSEDPLIGSTIADRYLIENCIGEGGMGRVYRARHQRVSRRFALKVLFGDYATDPKMRERFAREAEAASRLSHPNVISVMDFGETPEGLLYLAMDYVEGGELETLISSEGPLARERVVGLLRQLSLGLQHAHDEGLIHRDFKAENVIVSRRGDQEVPRIVDFGIAVMLEAPEARMTTEGVIIGTPAYMSPEQATGQELDARSDLFSLGVVTYAMLAGVPPFEGAPMDIARKNVSVDPPPINERVPGLQVDPALEAIARKLMAKRPEDRYQSAAEVLQAVDEADATVAPAAERSPENSTDTALERGVTGSQSDSIESPPRGRRALIAVAALLLLAGVSTIYVFGHRAGPASSSSAAQDAGATLTLAALPSADASPPPIEMAAPAIVDDVDGGQVAGEKASRVPTTERPDSLPTHDEPAASRRQGHSKRQPHAGPNSSDDLPATAVKADAVKEGEVAAPGNTKSAGHSNPTETPAPKAPSSQDLTQLYVAVGESLQRLQQLDPNRARALRANYSAIPFNDGLRVSSLRMDVQRRLQSLRAKIDKELKQ